TADDGCSSPTTIVALAAGGGHSLVLKEDGTVWAWGNNLFGQLGDGTTTNRSAPVRVVGLSGVISVAAGYEHSLALTDDGTVWAWGKNWFGQLGVGTSLPYRSMAEPVVGIPAMKALSGGGEHTLALAEDGTVWAWGKNWFGQLGVDTSLPYRAMPEQVTGIPAMKTLSAGGEHSLALAENGTVWAWGKNWFGQLGTIGTYPPYRTLPEQVPWIFGVQALDAGEEHSLLLGANDSLWEW
ncbi:MAG TPA: hypothetical protein VIU40_14005, partial [Geobacteraceae bacterium]